MTTHHKYILTRSLLFITVSFIVLGLAAALSRAIHRERNWRNVK